MQGHLVSLQEREATEAQLFRRRNYRRCLIQKRLPNLEFRGNQMQHRPQFLVLRGFPFRDFFFGGGKSREVQIRESEIGRRETLFFNSNAFSLSLLSDFVHACSSDPCLASSCLFKAGFHPLTFFLSQWV